jgi:hypothetical protein
MNLATDFIRFPCLNLLYTSFGMPRCLPRLEGIPPEGTRDASKGTQLKRQDKGQTCMLQWRHCKISAGEESLRGNLPLTSSRGENLTKAYRREVPSLD